MHDVIVLVVGMPHCVPHSRQKESGASVLVIEAAPKSGVVVTHNTRNLRCMHDASQDVLVDAYPEEEYWQDHLK